VRRNLRSRALLFRGGGRPEQHGVHGLHVLILLVLVLFRSIRGLEHLVSLKTWARTDVCWWAGRGVILTRECASSLLARLACLCVVRLLCACACVRVCARVCARFHLVSCQPAAHVLRDARHVDRERHHEILERAKLRQLPDLALRTAHPALLDRWRAPRRGAEHRVAGAHDRGQNTAVSEVMVERSGRGEVVFFVFPRTKFPAKNASPNGKACQQPCTMAKVDAGWSSADLAKAVCDELVAKGLLKEKPAFIRSVAALRPPRAPAGQLLHAAPGICPCESGGATDSRAGSRVSAAAAETARRSLSRSSKRPSSTAPPWPR